MTSHETIGNEYISLKHSFLESAIVITEWDISLREFYSICECIVSNSKIFFNKFVISTLLKVYIKCLFLR